MGSPLRSIVREHEFEEQLSALICNVEEADDFVMAAERVLSQIGIDHLFDDIFDIVHSDYHPKPKLESFDRFLKRHDVTPSGAAMFEDLDRNLAPAHQLGMTTVFTITAQ